MKKLTLVLMMALYTTLTFGSEGIVLDNYDLTEQQREVILRLQERGMDHETLHRFAQALERHNQAQDVYIPPHTPAELQAVVDWAAGGAFAAFASNAQIEFDGARYWEDCPNKALFNFGRATAREYLSQDVLTKAINVSTMLTHSYARDPENFPTFYREQIAKTPFAQYVDLED